MKRPKPIAVLAVRRQARGAWPNGSRVRKINSQPDDGTPNGTIGKIIGSVDVSDMKKAARFAYFVEWEAGPGRGLPVAVVDINNDGTPRLELAEPLQ